MMMLELKTNNTKWEMHSDVLANQIVFYGCIDNKRTAYYGSCVQLIREVEENGQEIFFEL